MSETKVFEASPEAKGKAKQLRIFAILAWLVAMAGQVFAILKLISDETLVWLVVAIVVILILAITGSTLWKKANRLDPASEKDETTMDWFPTMPRLPNKTDPTTSKTGAPKNQVNASLRVIGSPVLSPIGTAGAFDGFSNA